MLKYGKYFAKRSKMKMFLAQALQKILLHVESKQECEWVELLEARGRINAKAICAKYDIPSCDISLRDGLIVPKNLLKNKDLKVSSLQRVYTGSKLKEDFTCIVEIEHIDKDILSYESIERFGKKKSFVKPKGEDIKKGTIILEQGKMISSFDVANLASQGISRILVYKKIKIAYIGVGEELVDIKESLHVDEIYNSNAYAIATRGKVLGAEVRAVINAKNKKELKEIILSLKDCDLIITIGGMSKGDVVDELLDEDDFGILFKGVALAPAGLSAFSFLAQTPLLHLPGLPLSALLGFEILGAETISRLYGQDFTKRAKADAICTKDIKYQKISQSVVPGFFDGRYFKPSKAKAGMMNVLNYCNGYVLTSMNERIKKGDRVVFYPFLAWG